MPQRKKLFVILIIIVVAIGAGVFLRTRSVPPENIVSTTGVMEATEVELSPKIAGRVAWVCCKEGDAIKAGDIAVRLDSDEIKARVEEKRAALTGAESGITEAKVALENAFAQKESARFDLEAAGAEVKRAEALLNEASENVERARGLFKDGYMAKKELDAAEAAFASASAVLSTAKARSRSSQAVLRNSEVNIKRRAQG
ncbi:MAG: biotin/lipoyl-binding protein [Deltaproteobacteria bacterium]|nr:biotin/lipoyl-binding protein [Deltaproteobacteria bacterium]